MMFLVKDATDPSAPHKLGIVQRDDNSKLRSVGAPFLAHAVENVDRQWINKLLDVKRQNVDKGGAQECPGSEM
jgi:hypothetical protein